MGIPCKIDIAAEDLGWQCAHCNTPLCKERHHIPGDFRGKYGDADFFSHVVNVTREPAKVQHMTSGEYITQNVNCRFCDEYLGWTYVRSFDPTQQYKVGKFCLEAEQTLHNPPPPQAERQSSFGSSMSMPDKARL